MTATPEDMDPLPGFEQYATPAGTVPPRRTARQCTLTLQLAVLAAREHNLAAAGRLLGPDAGISAELLLAVAREFAAEQQLTAVLSAAQAEADAVARRTSTPGR